MPHPMPFPLRPRRLAAALVAGALLAAAPLLGAATRAADGRPEDFFGTYVGTAEVHDLQTGAREQRDMDIVVDPYDDGFRLHWVNVTLVDGKRAAPGVQRRVQTVLFEEVDDRDFYVEVEEGNPFRERQTTRPMQGDPVRWAAIDDGTMHVYSFVVLEDGRYEMQVYDRILTETGMDIEFRRIVDGEVLRRISGTTARAGSTAGAE